MTRQNTGSPADSLCQLPSIHKGIPDSTVFLFVESFGISLWELYKRIVSWVNLFVLSVRVINVKFKLMKLVIVNFSVKQIIKKLLLHFSLDFEF